MELKKIRLKTLFIRYLTVFCLGTLLLLLALLLLFDLGIRAGAILRADHAQTQIQERRAALEESPAVTPELVPSLCDYGVLSAQGEYVAGGLSEAEMQKALGLLAEGLNGSGSHFYAVLQRTDGQVCVLRYSMVPQFRNEALRRLLPNPELCAMLLFLLFFALWAVLLSFRFGKRLSQKISGLGEAAGKIQRQDLDFSVQPCGIRELDQALTSLDQLKTALKSSLQQQWALEGERREQIAALAHDLKTPLTVIRGNAELLEETAQDAEQRAYNRSILNGAAQLEQYLQELILLSKSQEAAPLQKTVFQTAGFLEALRVQAEALGAEKHLAVSLRAGPLPQTLTADRELLTRALSNLLLNGVEYSPAGGALSLEAVQAGGMVSFTATDSGPGFSPEALKRAAEQFYMGDASRGCQGHHGMGLSIARSAAQRHGGRLLVKNAPEGGGQVTLELPL